MNEQVTPRVEIHYCPGCRWLPRAAWMAQELLTTFADVLGEAAIVPADAGVFEIWLDGECLHSRSRDGGFPELRPIRQAIRNRLEPGRDLGHSDR